MLLLSIGFADESSNINDKFNELCTYLRNNEINIAMVENDIAEYHYIKLLLKDSEKDIKNFDNYRDLFLSYATDIIYEYISKNYEMKILEKLIRQNYGYFSPEEMEDIKQKCGSYIMGTGILPVNDVITSMKHRNEIYKKIEDYLQESNEIIIDGFVKFRLKNLEDDISEILDRMIEEYMVEREYDEFIKLLRYFVEIQESKYDVLNIYINQNGDYTLKDGNSLNITRELFADFEVFNENNDTTVDDILLSIIVTCAPRQLIIHSVENCRNKEIIETIKNIFLERTIFCDTCEDCKIIRSGQIV
ncbi:YtxC-like family protein [Caloramator mitchellensis]|uniref:YtxC-like family protein n=1 Tax=Caloramator mitchellensis TaxID=908809 RepID=A0A0R3JUU4_CALMK|nr:putative sporulation protein YtxC [Caloramator mitchellensis]KRQ87337.1 YtxC-like family protein [Caloramator mitchellensis]